MKSSQSPAHVANAAAERFTPHKSEIQIKTTKTCILPMRINMRLSFPKIKDTANGP
jgi:hypothetical protein